MFSIQPDRSHVELAADRTATVNFTVQNKSGVARAVRGVAVPGAEAEAAWYKVEPVSQPVRVDETVQYALRVTVPADAPGGPRSLRLKVMAEDDPDDTHAESAAVELQVPEAPPTRPFPWWALAIAAAVLLVIVVVGFLVLSGDGEETDEVPVGDPIPFGPITSAEDPRLAGVVARDEIRTLELTRDGSTVLTAELQDRVVRSTSTGNVVFGPRIRSVSDDGTGWRITALAFFGYEDAGVEAAFRTDGLGSVAPAAASRTSDGDALIFTFGGLTAGTDSRFLSIFTDATAFGESGTLAVFARNIAGDEASASFPVFAPESP